MEQAVANSATKAAEGVAATATPVTVRVIAVGGKFLGDDVAGALVGIRDIQTGELLGRYVAEEFDTARLLRCCYEELKARQGAATPASSAVTANFVFVAADITTNRRAPRRRAPPRRAHPALLLAGNARRTSW